MKIFLIIMGCILLYIFGAFVTFIMVLYIDRCIFESPIAYKWIDEGNIGFSLGWPITIWFALVYLLYLKLKKYAIAITEVLYQINHKEDKDE